ncbi:MAG: HAD family phosphatase [Dehalococcoidales bacterium]|nr:MAG: HAD family phosphatase [Dehalococcoidales bacterium]
MNIKTLVMIRLACFDLDGTLVTETNTFRFIAEKLGFLDMILEYEEKERLGLLPDNKKVAQDTANLFKGISTETIKELLSDVPRIANIEPTVTELKKRGLILILASIQWDFLVEPFATEYGFDSYCGTGMKIQNDILTGELENFCTAQDKLQYFLSVCNDYNIPASDTIAIGDSKSDHPVFKEVGTSIVLNADGETKKLATHSIETDDLLDILPFFK